MNLPGRCLLALLVLGSACSKDAAGPSQDPGSESAGKGGGGGNTPRERGGAGGAGSGAGRGGAGSAAGSDDDTTSDNEATSGSAAASGSAATSGNAATGGNAGASGASGGDCKADCEAGEHCELVQVTCVRAPCPPQPTCVPDGTPADPPAIDCDPRKVTCKRTAPECPEMQVPSVEGSCYGDCVDVHACPCTGPEACPLHEKYTCNMSAKHCTPYLN